MEFSARDLEDIQRVAGLLNLTVDELIQQRRASNQSSHGQSVVARQFPAREAHQQPPYSLGDGQDGVSSWQHVHLPSHETMDVESIDFDDYTDQPSVASVTSNPLEEATADVILLNPQTVV